MPNYSPLHPPTDNPSANWLTSSEENPGVAFEIQITDDVLEYNPRATSLVIDEAGRIWCSGGIAPETSWQQVISTLLPLGNQLPVRLQELRYHLAQNNHPSYIDWESITPCVRVARLSFLMPLDQTTGEGNNTNPESHFVGPSRQPNAFPIPAATKPTVHSNRRPHIKEPAALEKPVTTCVLGQEYRVCQGELPRKLNDWILSQWMKVMKTVDPTLGQYRLTFVTQDGLKLICPTYTTEGIRAISTPATVVVPNESYQLPDGLRIEHPLALSNNFIIVFTISESVSPNQQIDIGVDPQDVAQIYYSYLYLGWQNHTIGLAIERQEGTGWVQDHTVPVDAWTVKYA